MYRLKQIANLHCQFDARYQKNLINARVTVFAGLNQVSASLKRFKPRVAETGFCLQKPNPALLGTWPYLD